MKATRTLLRKYKWYTPAVWGSALFEFVFLTIEGIALFPVVLIMSMGKYYKTVIIKKFGNYKKTEKHDKN
jgi:hypothetical protein